MIDELGLVRLWIERIAYFLHSVYIVHGITFNAFQINFDSRVGTFALAALGVSEPRN